MSYLLDSNIIIYASKKENESLRLFIKKNSPEISFVSYVEVLGFNFPDKQEKIFAEDFFKHSNIHLIDLKILDSAVLLRKVKKISLADAIIAATAIVGDLTLVTHNKKDFEWIMELKLFDPFVDAKTNF